jgi:hypothetical protein
VIIHAYNDHVRLLSPEPLVVNNHSLLGAKEPTLLCNHSPYQDATYAISTSITQSSANYG